MTHPTSQLEPQAAVNLSGENPAIQVEGVGVRYAIGKKRHKTILENINLDIAAGSSSCCSARPVAAKVPS